MGLEIKIWGETYPITLPRGIALAGFSMVGIALGMGLYEAGESLYRFMTTSPEDVYREMTTPLYYETVSNHYSNLRNAIILMGVGSLTGLTGLGLCLHNLKEKAKGTE